MTLAFEARKSRTLAVRISSLIWSSASRFCEFLEHLLEAHLVPLGELRDAANEFLAASP